MKRILFVDDEPRVLDGLRRMLRQHRDEWDTVFAVSAQDALEALAVEPFDIVISDVVMPGMDGVELLARVRTLHPTTVRIILSGETNAGATLKAVDVSHQMLTKPCDRDVLKAALRRICASIDLLDNPALRELVSELRGLPSAPSSYMELRTCIRLDAPLRDVVAVVERDVGLSAKVLQLANSAYFGLPHRTTSIQRAVACLGLRVLGDLTLMAGVFQSFDTDSAIPQFSVQAEQRHALLVARAASHVADDACDSEEVFLAGMMHDVGKLVVASRRPELFCQLVRASESPAHPNHQDEQAIWGFGHAELGACLLGMWGLPLRVIQGVAHHHTPLVQPGMPMDIAAAVHLGDALVREIETDNGSPGPRPSLNHDLIESLDVRNHLGGWRAAVRQIVTADDPLAAISS